MALSVRRFHLAVLCLALLTHATTDEHDLLPHRPTSIAPSLPLPPCSSLFLPMDSNTPSMGTGCPASSHHHQKHAPSSPSTLPGASAPRRLDISPIASEAAVAASAPNAPPAPPHVDFKCAAAVDAVVPAKGCITCTVAAPPTKKALLLGVLPLFAIPFLPPALAALVALSSMASPVRAHLSDDCFQLTHAICAVYPYDAETRTIDRSYPLAGMLPACLHPLCDAGSCMRNISVACGELHGRWGDPLHAYCTVHSIEAKGDTWHYLPILPIADPHALAASGTDVCYVELAHFNYREGYYVRCPVDDCSHVPLVSCTEFPPEAVASAVWEHRRTTYRDTVGQQFVRYTYDTVRPLAV